LLGCMPSPAVACRAVVPVMGARFRRFRGRNDNVPRPVGFRAGGSAP
jgi:hypothetical protein